MANYGKHKRVKLDNGDKLLVDNTGSVVKTIHSKSPRTDYEVLVDNLLTAGFDVQVINKMDKEHRLKASTDYKKIIKAIRSVPESMVIFYKGDNMPHGFVIVYSEHNDPLKIFQLEEGEHKEELTSILKQHGDLTTYEL
jgi:hypothetical protein